MKKALSLKSVSQFCKQLSMLVRSGVPLREALNIMIESTATRKQLYGAVADSVSAGKTLADSLSSCGCFPEYLVRMSAIGEKTGKLDAVLESLYRYYERSARLKESVRNAILYPLAMVFIMLGVIAVLLTQALPIFSQVFDQIGIPMPPYLSTAADSGGGILLAVYILFGFLALGLVCYFALQSSANGRHVLVSLFEQSIFTKKLAASTNSGLFISALSMLLSSGVNADDSAAMLGDFLESDSMRTKAASFKESLASGIRVSRALAECGMLSGEYVSMLSVAERAGNLDEMMDTVAQQLAAESDERINRLLSAIEPTIVIIMSVIVGAVLLSIMLPIMQVMSSL